MITDAQYIEWLRRDGQHRVVLIEAMCYANGAAHTEYMSNYAYVSESTDDPPDQPYDDIVLDIPAFEISLKMPDPTSGKMQLATTSSWGEITVSNAGGKRDGWLNRAWDGWSISFYLGSPDWEKTDFRLIMQGTIEDISVSGRDELTLILRGREYLLEVPVQPNTFTTGDNANKPKPLLFGNCFNIEPVLESANHHRYQIHDGSVNAISQVRDSGLSISHTQQLSHGMSKLTQQPSSRITADAQGEAGSGYISTAADIVQHLLLRSTDLQSEDLNSDSFVQLNLDCPQTLGIYLKSSDATVLNIITQVLASVGAFWVFSSDGRLSVHRWIDPATASADHFIDVDDIEMGTFEMTQRSRPVTLVRMGYARNWSVQKEVAGGVSETNRQRFGEEYRVAMAKDNDILTAHKLAFKTPLIPTLLTVESQAQAECNRVLSLLGVNREWYEFEGFVIPQTFKVGDIVNITHKRYGFENGKNALVIGLSSKPTSGKTHVELWA